MKYNGLTFKQIILGLLLLVLSSCTPLFDAKLNPNSIDADEGYEGPGGGFVYLRNPVVQQGGSTSSPDYDTYRFSRRITTNNQLTAKCFFRQFNHVIDSETEQDCIQVFSEDIIGATSLSKGEDDWYFSPGSESFYQVNAFYHVNSMIEQMRKSLEFSHSYQFQKTFWSIPTAMKFDLSVTKGYWLINNSISQPLKIFTKIIYSDLEDYNAYFSPADNELGFGFLQGLSSRMIQDPSVIYHELGHAFVKILLNQRNSWVNGSGGVDGTLYQNRLGHLGYDEAGALNEGIADFFSYFMTRRTHIGEWALGDSQINASRPMSDTDSLHYTTFTQREKLSYPRYVYYNPNRFGEVEESRQNAGQITSHYLVALHKSLQNTCSFPANNTTQSNSIYLHEKANDYVLMLLSETLAELGDYTSKLSDFYLDQNVSFANFNPEQSFLWSKSVGAINHRSFYKTFAKNILHNISNSSECSAFTKDQSEILLDKYGLLLFKEYDDQGVGRNLANLQEVAFSDITPNNGVLPSVAINLVASTNSTTVNEINRVNSILISKDQISLPSQGSGLPTGFLIDDRDQINNILSRLTFKGIPVSTTTGLVDTNFNNNNLQIGPGEVIALSPNLFNNSNSPIAGVQLLANDWDHMRLTDTTKTYVNVIPNQANSGTNANIANHKPCKIENWPSISEGGVEDSTNNQGDCSYNSKTNEKINFDPSDLTQTHPQFDLDSPQPICVVKFSDNDEQRWVTQDFFRKTLNLEDQNCLNNAAGNSEFNPNSCFVRVLPGASQASFAKLDPSKTYSETITSTGSSFELGEGNIILFEVNKETPPGTVFTCRMRARMSNCSDCYNDENGQEYRPSDFTGAKPFKVINFEFTVTE